jgi:hypothetical protein
MEVIWRDAREVGECMEIGCTATRVAVIRVGVSIEMRLCRGHLEELATLSGLPRRLSGK